MRVMLKSKIHRATCTDGDVHYEGSVSIDPKLMKAADIIPFEQVQVLDIDNGNRLSTYAIEGKSGEICLNGAAARLVQKGDLVIILTYENVENENIPCYHPKLVYVDRNNDIVSTKGVREEVLV